MTQLAFDYPETHIGFKVLFKRTGSGPVIGVVGWPDRHLFKPSAALETAKKEAPRAPL